MRLAPEDFTYWFVSRAFGWSVVLQVLWTFDRPPAPQLLTEVAQKLAHSPLNRALVGSRVPFGRPRWVHSGSAPDLVIDGAPIGAENIEAWASDEMYTAPLDVEHGHAWRLRGAPTEDGGFVLSLVALHLVTDGQGMVTAAADALSGRADDDLAGDRHSALRSVLSDAADALRLIGESVLGMARAARSAPAGSAVQAPARPDRLPIETRSPAACGPWAIVSVNGDDWDKVADHHGGTANSLFVAVISGLLRSSGHTPLGQTVKVGIPVSNRTETTTGGNATAGVSVHLTDEPVAGGELGSIRRKCKAAFTALSAGRRPAMIHLMPLMWLVPTRLIVKAVSSGDGMPDAVVSNLGVFADGLAQLGDLPATGVAFRGIAQGVDPRLPYRFGDGVQSWLLEVGDQITFSVVAFDESAFADRAQLCRLLSAELDAWGVPHRIW